MLTHFLLTLDPSEDTPAVACGAETASGNPVMLSSSIEAETTCPDCLVRLAM